MKNIISPFNDALSIVSMQEMLMKFFLMWPVEYYMYLHSYFYNLIYHFVLNTCTSN